MARTSDALISEFNNIAQANKSTAVEDFVRNLSAEEKEGAAKALGIPSPDQKTANIIWQTVIWFFGTVMVTSALILSTSVFITPATSGTKPETILTVFTTVTAFLAGLLSPSPVQKKSQGS